MHNRVGDVNIAFVLWWTLDRYSDRLSISEFIQRGIGIFDFLCATSFDRKSGMVQ